MGDTRTPQQKAEMDRSDIRGEAIRGGYEDKLDEAIEEHGGSRTKEVEAQERAIRKGAGAGAGHAGDSSQPGLTGKEGTR